MKYIITFFLSSLSVLLPAQVFFDISNGYSFPLQNLELAYPYYNGSYNTYLCKEPLYNPNTSSYIYYIDHSTKSKKPVKMNFGSGYNINTSFGYYLGKHIGFSVTYLYNNTNNDFEAKKTYYSSIGYDFYNNPLHKNELIFTFYSITNSFTFNGIIKYPIKKHLIPFVKLGISISSHEIFFNREKKFIFYNNFSESDGFKEKYYGKNSLGSVFSLGTMYKVKDFIFLFECKLLFDKFSPSNLYSYDYYEINPDGNNVYSVPNDHDVVLEDYSNGGDIRYNDIGPYLSDTRYKTKFSFSTISINIGVQYTLTFKKKD